MNGRAVYKELSREDGTSYTAWLQLNFKETDAQGQYAIKQYPTLNGLDIERRLTQSIVREMFVPEEKTRVIASLQEGNRTAVTIGNTPVFVEAAPQFKSMNLYEANEQRAESRRCCYQKTRLFQGHLMLNYFV
jgi:hypothetical protein